jgi:poly-gamma-glutamate capsule biosynthesis protein CapA/YwtB (metallophosphatase superfamily)
MAELTMSKWRSFCLLMMVALLVSCGPAGRTVTLALLGDLMVGRGVDPKADSLAYLAPELNAADIVFANLESPLAERLPVAESGGGYNLCASSSLAQLLSAWGLDLLSIANNHVFDCGPLGPWENSEILQSAGIMVIGPTTRPFYKKVNGLMLFIMAFDDVSAPLDADAVSEAIRQARASGALVVVSVHWGMEYQSGPSERQIALAKQFADAGAALIVGSHPHVLQRTEWIDGPSSAAGIELPPPLRTLVLYSLGNALFDQGGLADTRQSALVLLTLDARGVSAVRAVPFAIDVVGSRVVAPDAAAAQSIHDRLKLP